MMTPDVFEYVLYQIFNTPLRKYPFDHYYIEDVFPEKYFQLLLSNLPERSSYVPIEKLGLVTPGSYSERFVFPLFPTPLQHLPVKKRDFWEQFNTCFGGEAFQNANLEIFKTTVEENSLDSQYENLWELMLDTTSYSLGPHTDSPSRVISILIYLLPDHCPSSIGTALFTPRDPSFESTSGKHYHFDDFKLVTTVPFKPNALFAFARTNTSFHGVLPIREKMERFTLQYQILKNAKDK